MAFLKKLPAVFLCVVFISACTKVDKKITPTPMYYSYFPLKTGLVRYYNADSLIYTTIHKHVQYQLKELYEDTYINSTGETVYRISRFTRLDTNGSWQPLDVITRRRNDLEALQTEGNIIYMKLIFPVKDGASWDFNKYNSTDSTHIFKASYAAIHQPFSLNGMSFDSTVMVNYISDSSFINIYKHNEHYAAGVGMITKFDKHLDIQPGTPPNPPDTSGYIYKQTLTGYSK